MSDGTPEIRVGDAERHQVAEILRQAAGEGRLDLDELDERLGLALTAKTHADLVPLTRDLPVSAASSQLAGPWVGSRLAPQPIERERHAAIMSGFTRRGVWTVPRELQVAAVMGGADLDLREAVWSGNECVITVFAFWGGLNVVVGPEVDVRMEGAGIMGGFDGPSGGALVPGGPVLRVRGVAIMGGVSVQRKEPKQLRRQR